MSGGNLTVNQEKQMRLARGMQEQSSKVGVSLDVLPKIPLWQELTKLYGQYRELKNSLNKNAGEIRRDLLAQMDEILEKLTT